MPLHQALTRYRDQIRTILPRHEQGGGFAAQGYARTTGKPASSWPPAAPGRPNLVTCHRRRQDGLASRSSPSPARSARTVIGTDAFQETPIVEVCRGDHQAPLPGARDAERHRPRREGGVPHRHAPAGPARCSSTCPRTCRTRQCRARLRRADEPARLPACRRRATPERDRARSLAAIKPAKRPIIYAGGGIIAAGAAEELREFAEQDRHPRRDDRCMGLGAFPSDHYLSLRHARHARHACTPTTPINEADLLLALGVRFDDRVTGKVSEFAKHGKIVHVDIDASEINKNKAAHIPIVQRREVRPRRAEQDRRAAGRHRRLGRADATTGRSDEPFNYDQDVRRHPAAVRHRTSCRS